MLVFCDNNSGVLALFHQEYFISHKKEVARDSAIHIKVPNRFIVSMNPRVVLIPSVSKESGPVIDYTLIRSPAKNILVTYKYLNT